MRRLQWMVQTSMVMSRTNHAKRVQTGGGGLQGNPAPMPWMTNQQVKNMPGGPMQGNGSIVQLYG